jgi:hypothetical protein
MTQVPGPTTLECTTEVHTAASMMARCWLPDLPAPAPLPLNSTVLMATSRLRHRPAGGG